MSTKPALVVVTGAPGSGKSALVPAIARALPDVAVFDIDALVEPVSAMLGVDIRNHRAAWPAYRQLWMAIVAATGAGHRPVVLFANVLPSEVEDAARRAGIGSINWLVLDSSDHTRALRLRSRGEAESVIAEACADAAELRRLGARVINNDSTDLTTVTADIVRAVNALTRSARSTHG